MEETDLFDRLPIHHTIDRTLEDDTINRNLPTNWSRMLQTFKQGCMSDLNGSISLILNPNRGIIQQAEGKVDWGHNKK